MKKLISLLLVLATCGTYMWAQESKAKELERVQAASRVLDEIMKTPDKGIPQEILSSAECVAVIPSMIKGAFVFGGRYGKGIATCRTGMAGARAWSAPAPVMVEGGSWGFQFGGQAVDVVMLAMNQRGMADLLKSKFKIGADASAAAGPVGRHAEAGTDWKMRSELLTYSRARGAFVGISLDGAVFKQDFEDTVALYGKDVNFRQILSGKVPPPAGTQQFLANIHKRFGEAQAASNDRREAKAQSASDNTTTAQTTGGTAGSANTASNTSERSRPTNEGVAASTQNDNKSSTATTTETTPASQSSDQVRDNIQNTLHNTANLASSNVKVDVTDSQVTLSGSVPNQSDKATIRRLAEQNANGRRVVDDNLAVK